MAMQTNLRDDMPAEIEFPIARGKFFKLGTAVNLLIDLDAEGQATLSACAKVIGFEIGQLVNELSEKDTGRTEAAGWHYCRVL